MKTPVPPRDMVFVAEDDPVMIGAIRQIVPADRLILVEDVPTGRAQLAEYRDRIGYAMMDYRLLGNNSRELLMMLDQIPGVVKFGMSGSKEGVRALETYCAYTFDKGANIWGSFAIFMRVCKLHQTRALAA